MLLENATPFAAIGFGDLHRDGAEMVVFCVRGSYFLSRDGTLTLASTQEIVLNDVYEGDPLHTPLVQVGDLIPYKPSADVTVLGHAYAPNGKAAANWEVGIAINGFTARLRVHGPRTWEPALRLLTPTWKLGPAELVNSVALDYRLAAGGYHVGDAEGRHEARNPIGPGVLLRRVSRVGHPLRAPQIEALSEPLTDPFATPEPRGFGPIPPFWAWRERHLGTRDEAWQKERCPQMPADLSYCFFQTAHPDLIMPYLRGDEAISLNGLVLGGGPLAFTLPGTALVAHHEWRDGRCLVTRLILDGLHLDLRAVRAPWRVNLTWRGWISRDHNYSGARLAVAFLADCLHLESSTEAGVKARENLI